MGIKKIKYILAAALALFVPAFSGCGGAPVTHSGIQIVQPSPEEYPQSDVSSVCNSFYNLLCAAAASQSGTTELPQATLQSLETYAEGAAAAAEQSGLTRAEFAALASVLASQEALSAVQSFSLPALAAIYGRISSAVGFGGAGRLTYSLVMYYYDCAWQTDMRRYEEYGYSYLLERAERTAVEKESLSHEVGLNNFVLALRTACAVGSLMSFGGQADISSVLTDGEIVTLIKAQKFTSLTLSDAGWQTLFSLAQRLFTSPVPSDFLACCIESGDAALISSVMNEAMSLVRTVQSRFTPSQAAYLRAGNFAALASSVFSCFTDADWQIFSKITSPALSGDYSAAASAHFGVEFDTYQKNIVARGITELEKSAGTDGFIEILEGYVGGKCPAAAFLLFYDRA